MLTLAAWSLSWLPAQPPATPQRYEALVGGRPSSVAPVNSIEGLSNLIHHAVDMHSDKSAASADAQNEELGSAAPPTRVWLDLTNGESLVVSFEQMRDDTVDSVTMRVRQTRVTEECELDDPSMCVDVGCVAVRWNLQTREGILIDLFKAKHGERLGCDLSSADNPKVKWGQLVLRVVDDVAAALRIRHVYLADESMITLDVWDERKSAAQSVPIKLQYLHPLLHGVGYYEQAGFYSVDKSEYYGAASSQGDAAGGVGAADMQAAQARAADELNAFRILRSAPFAEGQLARAISGLARAGATPPEASRVYRLAVALGKAHEQQVPAKRLCALRDAAEACDEDAPAMDPSAPYDGCGSLSEFVARHEAAMDAMVLSAPHLGELIRLLHERNRASARSDGADAGALRAGAMMRELLFDVFAVWRTSRRPPLKRKDYVYSADRATRASCLSSAIGKGGGPDRVGLGLEPLDPIIREAYFVCSTDEDGACELPRYEGGS